MLRVILGAVAALIIGALLNSAYVERHVDSTALSFAASHQPQAKWTVVGHTFDPWANSVIRGNHRFSGGIGPAWVIELTAPWDSKWTNYSSVVVVNAATGGIDAGDVLATK